MKDDLAKNIFEMAESIKENMAKDRRFFHKNAEVGFEMETTLEYIQKRLDMLGCEYRRCGRAGILAFLGEEKGRCVLLRADIDALPMVEKTELPYASANGNMHSCGHDLHAAMLLGSIEILCKLRTKIKGRIVFAFQPAEEVLAGARDMIKDGLLEYKPDIAMMIHVVVSTDMETGSVIISSGGVVAPSSDFFEIEIIGRSAHGSTPHAAKNALVCAARILFLIEELPSKEFSVSDDVVVSVGYINSGLEANVIAERAVLGGSIRAYDESVRQRVIHRIEEIASALSNLYGCMAHFSLTAGCPALINDENASLRAHELASDLLSEGKMFFRKNTERRGGGSDDFAYIAERVPSVMLAVSAGSKRCGYDIPQHNPKVLFDEDVLPYGAALFSYISLGFLSEENKF